MTQNSQDQKTRSQQLGRPGQRQQERLARLERRRRRRTIGTAVAVVVILLLLIGGYFLITLTRSNPSSNTAASSSSTPAATAPAAVTPTTASNAPFCDSATSTPATISYPDNGKAPATPPTTDAKTVTLPDGLQCQDIKVGTGAEAKTGSAVSVQYTGWLASTKQKFDSSYDHGGSPFSVTLGQHQVITGWEEGLVGMKVGGIRRLIIPAALGYGSTAQGPIPANSTLVFDVKVVSIQ